LLTTRNKKAAYDFASGFFMKNEDD